MKNKITIFDERNLEMNEGDTMVLISRSKLEYTAFGRETLEVRPVQPSISHGKIVKIEKTSDGFAEAGPTILVMLDNGRSFSFDGENGSHEFTWYKLS